MPTLTDSILDIKQEAPPHDHLLVADATESLANVVSDAVHAAHHMSAELAVYYRGALVKVDSNSSFSTVISAFDAKLQDPPDKDPVASDFPDDPR